MATKKIHVPTAGRCSPTSGPALCGRWGHYSTGDHVLIRRQAVAAVLSGDTGHLCARCVAEIRADLARMGD